MEKVKKQYSGNWFMRTLLGLCICFGMCLWDAKPVQAYEAENSFLRVYGEFMVRYAKLRATTVKGEQGTATYDELSNTLTLTNFKGTSGETIGIQNMSGLKIVLVGKNALQADYLGINANQKGGLTICGSGTLNISVGTRKIRGIAINTKGDLNIEK